MKAATGIYQMDRIPMWAKFALSGSAILLFLILLAVLALPIPAYLDFQVLYQTNRALLQGISPYDHAGQVQMIAQLANVSPEQVYILPFPYPPWYALSTLWLAWLPIEIGARVWLGINIVLLLASVWLMTDGWSPRRRMISFVFAILFLPVLGSLFVGQYGFPVLLGAALMIYALRHEKPVLTAVAGALLTFKPHIGGLILLVALVYLLYRRDAFGRRAFIYILAAGILLFGVGFLADRGWPLNYVRSLLAFQKDSGVSTCGLCASLPALIASRLRGDAGLGPALLIGLFIFVVLSILWILTRRVTIQNPERWIATSILIVLLGSPYLLNYDFLLLLVPLSLLAAQARRGIDWLLPAGAYLLPFVALGVLGRAGNFIYPLSAIILLVMLYGDTRQLDGSPRAA
jgi:hypothetical protein